MSKTAIKARNLEIRESAPHLNDTSIVVFNFNFSSVGSTLKKFVFEIISNFFTEVSIFFNKIVGAWHVLKQFMSDCRATFEKISLTIEEFYLEIQDL